MKVDVMVVPWRYFSTLQGHNYHAVVSSALRARKTFARNLPLLVIICLFKKKYISGTDFRVIQEGRRKGM